MNYAYLGKRLQSSAAENFPIFLADLCARADQAYLTPSTRALLERGDPGGLRVPLVPGHPRIRDPSSALELVSSRRPGCTTRPPAERAPMMTTPSDST